MAQSVRRCHLGKVDVETGPKTVIAMLLAAYLWITLVPSGFCDKLESSRYLVPRVGSRFFMRYNSKVDVLDYTSIFAYAWVFRINWDIQPVDSRLPFKHLLYSHHRSLHTSIEKAIDSHGYDGRACLAKAFCDVLRIQQESDIISNFMKIVFRTKDAVTCPEAINCPFSLIALAYSLYGSEENQ